MQILIENSSKENDIVLDPFCGSGSTPLACVRSNRKFIGSEIDNNYYKVIKERLIRETTGIKKNKLF